MSLWVTTWIYKYLMGWTEFQHTGSEARASTPEVLWPLGHHISDGHSAFSPPQGVCVVTAPFSLVHGVSGYLARLRPA